MKEEHEATQRNVPSRAEVSRAIKLAAGYLERACDQEGKFAYKVNIETGRHSESYNVIRHAGAIYALGMYNRAHPDQQAVETMVRAADFMRKNYLASRIHSDQLTIWSRRLNDGAQPDRQYAELGGTALGLVALAETRLVRPQTVSLSELQAMGRFLIFLQGSDGSFVHKYSLLSGPVKNWVSLYYPGEAALAFTYLYEADGSPQWLVAAGKALSYLAKTRAGLYSVPADHWALIATAKLLPHCRTIDCGASRDELIRHAVQVCNSILREQLSGTDLDGAFDPTGRTAPAATRLEGLLSALEFLPEGEGSQRQRIDSAANRGIAFLLRTQISSGPDQGGVPGARTQQAPDAAEIRVDYLQHALCAWLRYEKFNSSARNSTN